MVAEIRIREDWFVGMALKIKWIRAFHLLIRIIDKDKECGIWNRGLEAGSQDKRIRMASIMMYIVHSNVKNGGKNKDKRGWVRGEGSQDNLGLRAFHLLIRTIDKDKEYGIWNMGSQAVKIRGFVWPPL